MFEQVISSLLLTPKGRAMQATTVATKQMPLPVLAAERAEVETGLAPNRTGWRGWPGYRDGWVIEPMQQTRLGEKASEGAKGGNNPGQRWP